MNKLIGAVLLIFSITIIVITTNVQDTPEKANHKKNRPSLQELVEGRGAHEYLYSHDPNTETIPKDRLLTAKEETARILSRKAAIANVTWEERGPNNVSGRTRALLLDAADPTGETVFAGGVGGGLWKTEDGGLNWTEIDPFFENLAISSIAQDPRNSDIIYFGTGEGYGNIDAIRGVGMFKSTDGGATFSYMTSTNTSDFFFVNSISVVDNGSKSIVIAATNQGTYRSNNGGTTWIEKIIGRTTDLTQASNGDIYAGVDNEGIFKSTNEGASFNQVYTSTNLDGRIELAAAPSNSSVVYALFERNGAGTPPIRKTINGGAAWTDQATPLWNDQSCTVTATDWTRTQDWYDLIAIVDPNDENRVIIGGVDLFGTEDGANNWTQISSWIGACGRPFVHADQHALIYGNTSDQLWSAGDGGLFRSSDASNTTPSFTFVSNGYNVTQFYCGDLHPDEAESYYLAGAQDNGTQRFTMDGLNVTTSATGGDGGFCHIDQDNPDIQMTTFTRNNHNISTNGGASFSSGPSNNGGLFINPSDYDDEIKKLYAAQTGNSYFRWDNPSTGGNASQIVTVQPFFGTATHVRTSPNESDRVYFGTGGRVVRVDGASTGTSKTGVEIFNSGGGTVSCVEIETGNEDHIIVILSNYGVQSVHESTNATSATPTWTNIEGNLPDMPIRWGLFNPNDATQFLLGTELGVWSTDALNGAATDWQPTNANFANVRVDMLKTRPSDNEIIAVTHGRGMFSTQSFNNIVKLTKTAAVEANGGDTITYTLEVFNNKVTTTSNIVVTDNLNPNLNFVPGSLTGGTIAGSLITINIASMPPATTNTYTFKAVVGDLNFSQFVFEDDIEAGAGNWTIDNGQGPATWDITNTNSNSPSNSWFTPNTGTGNNTQSIILDPQTVPANGQLFFNHLYDTESGWDGGFVEISTNGGATWTDLGPNFIENGYNGGLGAGSNSDVGGKAAFTGNSGGFIRSRVDLAAYIGQSVQFRFTFGEDNNTNSDGWYIDDVQLVNAFIINNTVNYTDAQGDNLSSQVATIIFECMVNCGTCDDGILNNGEFEIDCGGPNCVPCDCTETQPTLVYDNTNFTNTDVKVKATIDVENASTINNGVNVKLQAGNRTTITELEVSTGGRLEVSAADCTEQN